MGENVSYNEGGPVRGSRPYLLGDRGPEPVVLPLKSAGPTKLQDVGTVLAIVRDVLLIAVLAFSIFAGIKLAAAAAEVSQRLSGTSTSTSGVEQFCEGQPSGTIGCGG